MQTAQQKAAKAYLRWYLEEFYAIFEEPVHVETFDDDGYDDKGDVDYFFTVGEQRVIVYAWTEKKQDHFRAFWCAE